jgi:hypothetical protein
MSIATMGTHGPKIVYRFRWIRLRTDLIDDVDFRAAVSTPSRAPEYERPAVAQTEA